MSARMCTVLLNVPDCTALPGSGHSTQATCYQCGNAACTECSHRTQATTPEGRRPVRICNDCTGEIPQQQPEVPARARRAPALAAR